MLLSVEPFDHQTEGTLLDLWFVGGQHKTVRPPCMPHFYSWVEQGNCEQVERRLLSGQPRSMFRVDWPTLTALERARHGQSFMDHKRFVDVLISKFGFKIESAAPSLLAWDSETFPKHPNRIGVNWREDTIRSIAVYGDGFAHCWRVGGGRIDGKKGVMDEPAVIRAFLSFVNTYDPDILAGYNDGDYDMRVLLSRCRFHRIRCRLGRDGSEPYVIVKNYERRGKEREVVKVRIHGRVHLDVYLEVMFDQTLYDLKGRGQVEVAKHFGFAPIEDVNHAAIPEDRLEETNIDDARCCYGLAELYLQNIYALCEELNVPLNLMCARSPSHIPNWFYGAAYEELGIVSEKPNVERFPQIFGRGGKPYQGALVKCFRRGIFRPVHHKDFASFYPSLQMEYNLSPETVNLVAMKPYTGEYRFDKYDDYWIIEVPDVPKKKGKPNWEKAAQIVCRIDMSHDSVTKKRLLHIRKERFRLKREYKKTKDQRLYSRQYALKVIQNTLYGYCGMRWSLYGNILVAILITALARYHMQAELVKPEYGKVVEVDGIKAGEKVIEVDTDGFYYEAG